MGQAVQRGEGLVVGRVDAQHLAVGLHGAGQVSQVAFPELADAVLEADGLGRGLAGELHLALQDLQQVVPALALLVEPVQGADAAEVLGVQVEDVGVGLDGRVQVHQLLLVDLAHLVVDLLFLLQRHGQLHLADVEVLEVLPTFQVEVEVLQRVHGPALAVIDVQDHLVHADGLFRALQQLVVDLGRAEQQLLALFDVQHDLCALHDHVHQVLVRFAAHVDQLQGRDRVDVLGVDGQDLLVGLGRPLEVLHVVLVDVGHLHVQGGRQHLVHHVHHQLVVQRHQVFPALQLDGQVFDALL